MELPDVEFCLNNEDVCQPKTQIHWCAAQWTSSHIALAVNGELRISKFSEARTDDGHLLLTFDLGDVPDSISSLDVTNDCFLNSFSQYENLFQVAVKDLNQGYLMNKERTSISINLTDRP